MKNEKSLINCMLMLFISTVSAQIPSELPHPDDNEPIDLSNVADIIIYIVLPIIIILLLVFRNRKLKKKKKNKNG